MTLRRSMAVVAATMVAALCNVPAKATKLPSDGSVERPRVLPSGPVGSIARRLPHALVRIVAFPEENDGTVKPLQGTGFLLDSRTVVTVAHNVPRCADQNVTVSTQGWLARSVHKKFPARVTSVDCLDPKRKRGDEGIDDLAVLHLDRPVDRFEPTFVLEALEPNPTKKTMVELVGFSRGDTTAYRQIAPLSAMESDRLYYRHETAQGMSGSPVYGSISDATMARSQTMLSVYAIHQRGIATESRYRTYEREWSSGFRITLDAIKWINGRIALAAH